MPRPKQRTPELHDRVLRVAVDTLARDGVIGFTTRRIAQAASTSTPAVYELFGDKAGLVRSVFFEGFRMLARTVEAVPETADPRADLQATLEAFRAFAGANPELTDVMFSQPFADFDPGPDEQQAGTAVRELIVGRVRRCGTAANPTDAAHVLVALVQGLAAQQAAGWMGTSQTSINRRWRLAFSAVVDGLLAAGSEPPPSLR